VAAGQSWALLRARHHREHQINICRRDRRDHRDSWVFLDGRPHARQPAQPVLAEVRRRTLQYSRRDSRCTGNRRQRQLSLFL